MNGITKTLDRKIGKAHNDTALGHAQVTDPALIDDRSQYILDELRCLGDLIKTYEDRLGVVDTELIERADTEAFVG